MSVIKKLYPVFGFALLAASGSLLAQDVKQIEVTTIVKKEVVIEKEDGTRETELVDADSVVPGERVVYTISFRNVGSEPADNVVITNPIAETLKYVAGSAAGDDLEVEFSVDGGTTFGKADALRVVTDGVERPATTLDYTHVRWVMQERLEAGSEGQASFAAVLE